MSTEGLIVNGMIIAVIEERYKGRYVGFYSIPGSGDGPFLVFYTDNPDRSLGHDNYFAFWRNPIDDEDIRIISGAKIRDAKWAAIEIEPGKFLVSRSVHDYVTHGPYMLDGGPYYTRCNLGYGPTHTMTVVDGVEVFTRNEKELELGAVEIKGTLKVDYVDEELLAKLAEDCAREDMGEITTLEYRDPLQEPNGLTGLMDDVRTFHHACDQPVLDGPQFPSQARVDLRIALIKEEWRELQDAVIAGDLVEIADALGDIVYVVCGMALEFGLPLDRVWAEIQTSNMLKVDPKTGKANKFPNGKVMKPEGWQPPNVRRALGLPEAA